MNSGDKISHSSADSPSSLQLEYPIVVIIEFHLNRNRQTNISLQTKNAERIVSIDFENTKYGVYLKNKMSHKNVLQFIEI